MDGLIKGQNFGKESSQTENLRKNVVENLKEKRSQKDITIKSLVLLNISRVENLPQFFNISEEIKYIKDSRVLQSQARLVHYRTRKYQSTEI